MVEHLFREEAAKMVAILTRIFGVEHLSLAEDVVQEALAKALQTWPYHGLPQNPSAWIMRVARNLALDVVRREKVFRGKEPEIARLIEQSEPTPESAASLDQEIRDDRLRMMFVCCHPLLNGEAQVALALKILCGFSVGEISSAFLTNEAVIAKRLTRAKQKLQEARVPFEIPEGAALAERLEGVLKTLYLLFNEGYKASSGDTLVRKELCQEAIDLTALLAQHPAGNQPRTHALLALMLLNGARLASRVDGEGNLLRLQEQDRQQWDRSMIARGMFHLALSATGPDMTEYHIQAAIAACHGTAPDYASTDWRQIQLLYDRLMKFDRSPIVALNRAVAVAKVSGPRAGLDALPGWDRNELESYHLLHAVRGDFEEQLGNFTAAAAHFRKARDLAELKSEKTFLAKRLAACENPIR
ncbi:MAG: putative polymerase, sigma-24 subunit, subfamily [Verrucomicrobiales bacterium]|nr:putative polymerase, sigma-24 subunit, subfamily [Verrucomicrobiales bacterium]